MTYYRFKDGKLEKALFVLSFFLMLVLSRNSMYTFTILPFAAAQLSMYAVVGLLGIAFLFVNRINLKEIFTDSRILAIILVTLIFLVPVLVKRDFQAMNFNILLCVYVAIFFSYFISYRELTKYYVLLVTFLGAYSLITCYLLAPMVERGLFSVPVVNYENWRIFHNFVFAFPRIKENYLRNFGMFREPGVYQYFLNLALFCNNFILIWQNKRKKWVINAILAVTMVSTFSTVAFVELVLMAVALFFSEELYKDKRIIRVIVIFGALGVLALIVTILNKGTLYKSLYEMVEKLFVINTSSAARYNAIFANLHVFFHNPLFGEKMAVALNTVANNTSSTLLMYAVFGIVGGTLNVAGWIALVWDKNRNLFLNVLLVVIMLMSVNTQNLTTDVFFWLFPTMALVERGLPLLKRKG